MRSLFITIPAALIIHVAHAQNGPAPITVNTSTVVTVSPSYTQPVVAADPTAGERIMDFKSVYEAATLEEEVQTATERFLLSKSQQEVWYTAAFDRRIAEKQIYDKLSANTPDYSKEGGYKALRMAQNAFYETIIGYLTPAQKQSLEMDRVIRTEKQRRLALLPPPPPPAPTVTVAPVDSTSIKEAEKLKAPAKKSKKKKKPAGS
ncbi:MAG: hypothetical protein K0R26_2074 [Bacteroidota bacterium]|jgi:hypothetical protein|nr:hypothetical protein [Bacteroidota bacterium]